MNFKTARPADLTILPVTADKTVTGSDPFDDPFEDLHQQTVRPQEIRQPLNTVEDQSPNRPAATRIPSAPVEEEAFPLKEIVPQEQARSKPTRDCVEGGIYLLCCSALVLVGGVGQWLALLTDSRERCRPSRVLEF